MDIPFDNELYGEGSRKLSILHARLRHQCSSLNSDLYRINITKDLKCQYGAPYEDSIHYLRHDIFGLFLTFRSKLFHNETVDGIKDVKDILSLLLGVV
jgi:hypothetical protein